MVDVTHDADDGASRNEILRLVLRVVEQLLLDGDDNLTRNLRAELVGDEIRGVKIDRLVDGRHDAEGHQLLYDFSGGHLESRRELADRDLVRNGNLKRLLLCLLNALLTELFHSHALFFTLDW